VIGVSRLAMNGVTGCFLTGCPQQESETTTIAASYFRLSPLLALLIQLNHVLWVVIRDFKPACASQLDLEPSPKTGD